MQLLCPVCPSFPVLFLWDSCTSISRKHPSPPLALPNSVHSRAWPCCAVLSCRVLIVEDPHPLDPLPHASPSSSCQSWPPQSLMHPVPFLCSLVTLVLSYSRLPSPLDCKFHRVRPSAPPAPGSLSIHSSEAMRLGIIEPCCWLSNIVFPWANSVSSHVLLIYWSLKSQLQPQDSWRKPPQQPAASVPNASSASQGCSPSTGFLALSLAWPLVSSQSNPGLGAMCQSVAELGWSGEQGLWPPS